MASVYILIYSSIYTIHIFSTSIYYTLNILWCHDVVINWLMKDFTVYKTFLYMFLTVVASVLIKAYYGNILKSCINYIYVAKSLPVVKASSPCHNKNWKINQKEFTRKLRFSMMSIVKLKPTKNKQFSHGV